MRHAEPAPNSYHPDGPVCRLFLWGDDVDESPNAADWGDSDAGQARGKRGAAGDGLAGQSPIRPIASGLESGGGVADGNGAD